MRFDQLLLDYKLASSKSEARRLIKQNAVKLRWGGSDTWRPVQITAIVPRFHNGFDVKAGHTVVSIPPSEGTIEKELARLDRVLMESESKFQSQHPELQYAIVNGRRAYVVYSEQGRKIGCTLIKMAAPKKPVCAESGELDGLDDASIRAYALESALRLVGVFSLRLSRLDDGKWWLSCPESLMRGGGRRFERFDTYEQAAAKVWRLASYPKTIEDWRELEARL